MNKKLKDFSSAGSIDRELSSEEINEVSGGTVVLLPIIIKTISHTQTENSVCDNEIPISA